MAKQRGDEDGAIVVLNALVASMEMSGMSSLVAHLNQTKRQEVRQMAQTWAEALWIRQKPCYRRAWADVTENGGRALMRMLSWEGELENKLCDVLELHGVLHATLHGLREIIRDLVMTMDDADTSVNNMVSNLDVFGEICEDQVVFANQFLQWQLRFGDMVDLLDAQRSTS